MHFGQKTEFVNVQDGGTHSNHWDVKGKISVIKTGRLKLYREIIAVYSEIHAKHINAFWAERRIVLLSSWLYTN